MGAAPKLTRKQKREMLWKYDAGVSPTALAAEYKITRRHTHRIVKGDPRQYDPCWSCGTEKLAEGETFCSMECEIKYNEAQAYVMKGDLSLRSKLHVGRISEQRDRVQSTAGD